MQLAFIDCLINSIYVMQVLDNVEGRGHALLIEKTFGEVGVIFLPSINTKQLLILNILLSLIT